MQVIEAIRHGGPEVLALRSVPTPEPTSGQVRVRVEASGVNYIDVYQRTGLYPLPLPLRLGLEGAGVVEAVAPDVRELAPGQRVAWSDGPGSYASHVCLPAQRLVPVPDRLSSELAAALMLQGMTAHYLTHATYPLGPGDTCLIHAAAGGVGLLACQLARRRGARVIGVTSQAPIEAPASSHGAGSPARDVRTKAELVRAAGADHVLFYDAQPSLAERVAELTDRRGVQVVYDSVGQSTWAQSLASLAPRGMLVLFGQSSGSVPPFDPQLLSRGGSLYLTRPTLFHYVQTRDELLERAGAVLGLAAAGELEVRIDRRLPLEQAAEAHRLLESRRTAGKLLLVP
jgi:NADPH2:quinone reductase